MWKITNTRISKLVKASNAMDMTYQAFSKGLKKFGFVKRVEQNKKAFQLPQKLKDLALYIDYI